MGSATKADGVRAGGDDQAVQLRRELLGGAEGTGTGEPGPVQVCSRDVSEAAQPALVGAAQRLAPGEVERTQAVAVVAPPPRDDDPAVAVVIGEVIRAGQLEGGLDRLGASRDGVDRGFVDRQVGSDLRRVGLDGFGGERAAVGEGEAARLLGHDPRDLLAPMADVDDDRATGRIEVLAAVRSADRGAMGLHRDGRLGHGGATEHASGSHAADPSGPGTAPGRPVYGVRWSRGGPSDGRRRSDRARPRW